MNLVVLQFGYASYKKRNDISLLKNYLTSFKSVIEAEVSKYPEPKVSITSVFVSLLLNRAGVALFKDGN